MQYMVLGSQRSTATLKAVPYRAIPVDELNTPAWVNSEAGKLAESGPAMRQWLEAGARSVRIGAHSMGATSYQTPEET